MSFISCENCANAMNDSERICKVCGYPQTGTKQEKISYNSKVIRLRDLVEDSDKSVKSMLSFAIIFLFMAMIVLIFSLIFNENHYTNTLVFGALGLVYFMLHRFGQRSSYLMVVLAFFFYIGHTIFEFSHAMFLKSPVGLDTSFLESRGASLVFAIIPIGYMIFRMALMIVLAKYLWIQLKMNRHEKIVRFLKSKNPT